MLKKKFPHKILWLASYPKSGNTWFRAFLSALMNEGDLEINNMVTDGIFSSREIFDFYSDITSRDLYADEAKAMIADVYRGIAARAGELSIFKVHDSFGQDVSGQDIIPADATLCAVYFVRNPLDIAGSLANHNNTSIDGAIKMLNKADARLAGQNDNLNNQNQFSQLLLDWSGHVNSWMSRPGFPVHVVRYEDMLSHTFQTFNDILIRIGWECPAEKVRAAISASSFDKLRQQEDEKGFAEKFIRSPKFFRSGTMNNWEKELSAAQAAEIISAHGAVMRQFGYIA